MVSANTRGQVVTTKNALYFLTEVIACRYICTSVKQQYNKRNIPFQSGPVLYYMHNGGFHTLRRCFFLIFSIFSRFF